MTTATLDHPPVATATEPRSSALAEHYRRQASSRNVRGDLLEVLGWVMMAVSVALFLADGGAARFTTIAGSFIGVGVIAGLLATTGLLLMLLLAARVNVIDKTLGQPRATALHSKLGDWVVIGLGIHAAFLVTGYALDSGVGILAEFASLWGSTFDFVLAVLGMVLLLAVVVSSIVAARKRLPYEVWHAIHLLSYAAVAVSIPHMFSMGGLFAPGTWQRWYWAGSLIVTITSEPGLHSGHRFRLIMDGQPVGEPGTSPVFPLQNIDRGTHQLSAEVIDSQGRIVERTPAQPFHMKRITLAEKRRTNPCQKEDWGVRLECPLKDKPKDPPKDIPLIPFI